MRIESIRATAYQVPTDLPEADGTLAWDSTTMVLVEATSDSGETGPVYTYSRSIQVVGLVRTPPPGCAAYLPNRWGEDRLP